MAQSDLSLRVLLSGAALAVVGAAAVRTWSVGERPLVIGVLVHSSERSGVAAAVNLAAAELSKDGKSRARPIRTLVRETEGDPAMAASAAERLIREEGVAAIVAECSSAECASIGTIALLSSTPVLSVRPTVRLSEESAVMDLAGGPNQRIVPAVAWALRALGTKVMLVSTEGPFQRVMHALVIEQVLAAGGELVGEIALPAGGSGHRDSLAKAISAAAQTIADASPTLIIAGVDEMQVIPFTEALRRRGIETPAVPTLHLGFTDTDLASLDARTLVGDYLVSSCVASASSAARLDFARRVRATGTVSAVGESTEAAYAATRLIGLAARRTNLADRASLGASIVGTSVDGPSHPTSIDPMGQGAWVRCGVARIEHGGAVAEAWLDERATRPQGWPLWRSRQAWVSLAHGSLHPDVGSHMEGAAR